MTTDKIWVGTLHTTDRRLAEEHNWDLKGYFRLSHAHSAFDRPQYGLLSTEIGSPLWLGNQLHILAGLNKHMEGVESAIPQACSTPPMAPIPYIKSLLAVKYPGNSECRMLLCKHSSIRSTSW